MRVLLTSALLCVVLLHGAESILTPMMRQRILNLHNQRRGTVMPAAANMMRMVWNPTLEMIAQEHTENCMWEPNDMRHGEAEHLFPAGVGESMALSYGRSAIVNESPAKFVQEWSEERSFYNITYNMCEPGRLCDHFTQLVSANTIAVGCGFHICQEFEFYGAMLPVAAFLTCNYGPRAEPGVRPYMAGPRCSYCPRDHQLCMGGLCTYGYAPPTTQAPTTAAPTTQAPTTAAPTTPAATTEAVTTAAAVTDSLTSGGPPGVTVAATQPFAGGVGASDVFNATEAAPTTVAMPADPMNCTNPTTTLEREMCWLQAWTDWRSKFDVWAHTNCPGP